MKFICCVFLSALLSASAMVDLDPVQKVIKMLAELEAKILQDGEAEQKVYEEYIDWCKTGAQDKQWEIKTGKANAEDLEAVIGKASATIEASSSKIEELSASISSDEADLKAATEIRDKESADFQASETELVDALDTLDRAIAVIQKNMRGSALVQTKVNMKDFQGVLQVLRTVIDAASMNVHDKQTLLAFAQSTGSDAGSDNDDEAADLGAPAPDAYKSHSSSIIDVLEDMKEKAESQLSELRKAEMNSKHNYELLKQSLDDQISVGNKEMQDTKTAKSSATETKAVAEGDLAVTQKDIAHAEKVLSGMSESCMQTATDHETSAKGRAEELKALAAARKAIAATTSGASGASFLQILSRRGARFVEATGSHLRTQSDLANFEVINLLRQLAKDQHSQEISLLASRIAATYRSAGAAGEDPFAKVKQLITEMIDRLIKEGGEEASHKAYCDKEMAETKKKKEELQYDIEKLTTKIDKRKSMSAKLKGEVTELTKEIAEITKSQAEAEEIRQKEHAEFLATKADLEQGLEGVRTALQILRDYYGSKDDSSLLQQPAVPQVHEKSTGAGGGIIAMIEVIESDLANNLAQETTQEDESAVEFEKTSQDNRISKTMKEQDVKYKGAEAVNLDKAVAEESSDLESTQNELDSVLEASKTLRGMCIAKPETYEERKQRREAEIKGLKEALAILDGEAVLLQNGKHGLRGVKKH